MHFSLFLKIKSLDIFVCVPNCSLVDNILDTFCIAQIWKHIGHYRFGFFILSGSSSISILFH